MHLFDAGDVLGRDDKALTLAIVGDNSAQLSHAVLDNYTTYHIIDRERPSCASQQNGMTDFRNGSKADVTFLNFDVRFTPESGIRCPELWQMWTRCTGCNT
jgi:hypothetical protein